MGEAFVYLNYFWLVINFVNTVGNFEGCKVTVSNHATPKHWEQLFLIEHVNHIHIHVTVFTLYALRIVK
jgi:hypothetical protein